MHHLVERGGAEHGELRRGQGGAGREARAPRPAGTSRRACRRRAPRPAAPFAPGLDALDGHACRPARSAGSHPARPVRSPRPVRRHAREFAEQPHRRSRSSGQQPAVPVLGPASLHQRRRRAQPGNGLVPDLPRPRLPARASSCVVLVPLLELRGEVAGTPFVAAPRRASSRGLRRSRSALQGSSTKPARERLLTNGLTPGKFSGIFALLRASVGETMLRRTSSARFWSSVCMPTLLPVWIDEYICATLFSRIRLRMAGVPIIISCAATRPSPSLVLQQRLRDHGAAAIRTASRAPCPFRPPGTRRRYGRSSWRRRRGVQGAEHQVAGFGGGQRQADRLQVAHLADQDARPGLRAAPSAARWRSDSVCGPISRWLIRHFFDSWTNSIGSSMVRMWPYSFSLMWLTIAASVVDLPEPVGPVTSTRPRGCQRAARRRSSGAFELFEREHLRRNRPEHGAGAAVLDEGVDAEARQVGNREREVAPPASPRSTCAGRRS